MVNQRETEIYGCFLLGFKVCVVVLTSDLRSLYAKNVPLVQADLHLGVLYCPEHLVVLEVPIKVIKAALMSKRLRVVNNGSSQKLTGGPGSPIPRGPGGPG